MINWIHSYGENNSLATATKIDDAATQMISFLRTDDVDYFTINLEDIFSPRINEIKLPTVGVSAAGKKVKGFVKGTNFVSPYKNITVECDSEEIKKKHCLLIRQCFFSGSNQRLRRRPR